MKPKREITLGEMQDECKKRDRMCKPECPYSDFCGDMLARSPDGWNLTDPPRFTEAQMAFLEQSYNGGVRKLESVHSGDAQMRLKNGTIIGVVYEYFIKVPDGQTLDLAEMFGKEETK